MISHVVEMTKGCTVFSWLCAPCQLRRKAAGWTVKAKSVIAWGCDDCTGAAQLAHGYATPTVAYLTTPPEAFVPAPGWVAPKPPLPWPLYLELQEAALRAARLERLRKEAK